MESKVLYDPLCIFEFIDSHFITFNDSVKPNPSDYNQWVDRFIFQGCSITIDNKLFVTAVGLKHFFSSFLAVRLIENKLEMGRKHSKFLNWILMHSYSRVVVK